jgi:hypothetical protein
MVVLQIGFIRAARFQGGKHANSSNPRLTKNDDGSPRKDKAESWFGPTNSRKDALPRGAIARISHRGASRDMLLLKPTYEPNRRANPSRT